jgi:hypothetical protein
MDGQKPDDFDLSCPGIHLHFTELSCEGIYHLALGVRAAVSDSHDYSAFFETGDIRDLDFIRWIFNRSDFI